MRHHFRSLTMLATTAAAASVAFSATAQAEFQSPSGNINCSMGTVVNGSNTVTCAITHHTWVAPPTSPDCHLNWGSRFQLDEGGIAEFDCYGQEMPKPDETLAYGRSKSLGAITCTSEPNGMTCRDSGTGHFFRVSRESYQLG